MENNVVTDIFDILVDYKIWFDKETPEGSESVIGEKKIDLLKAIDKTGSIKAASETINLDFKTAWDMVNSINERFKPHPLVVSIRGGGGGTHLTPKGVEILQKYSKINAVLKVVLSNLDKTIYGVTDELDGSNLQVKLDSDSYGLKEGSNVCIIPI